MRSQRRMLGVVASRPTALCHGGMRGGMRGMRIVHASRAVTGILILALNATGMQKWCSRLCRRWMPLGMLMLSVRLLGLC